MLWSRWKKVIRSKQNDTFLNWITTHDAILWKVARSYAHAADYKDLYQDLLIALWHAIPSYRDQAKPSTFIYRVALNSALNWNRSRKRYERRHVELEAHPSRFTAAASPELPSEHERRVEQLYAALGMLPASDRSLALLYLEDLSYRDIADVLGITETNVGVKLNRIKKRLAEVLRQTEPDYKEISK
jgi:RNA polymerase sigma-70 factor, ECF subfamily